MDILVLMESFRAAANLKFFVRFRELLQRRHDNIQSLKEKGCKLDLPNPFKPFNI